MSLQQSFLRVPPFPGAKVRTLVRPGRGSVESVADADIDQLMSECERLRVGGEYWNGDDLSAVAAKFSSGTCAVRRRRFREAVIDPYEYIDPFTSEPMSALDAVRLCGFWRRVIDSNREIGSAAGFAFWKRPTVAPLLWDGRGGPRFVSRAKEVELSRSVAVWKARVPQRLLADLEHSGASLIEVEDGFIRSSGLGADCVPPLSIVVDRLGAHFDSSSPSELEQLIENGPFGPELVERAARLRELIIASSIGKYGIGEQAGKGRRSGRLHVLVPGQVEDDRAVLSSAGPVKTNLELLRRVRANGPEAYIIYKPHPDVEAGHRAGRVPDEELLRFADEVVRDEPITALIAVADEVHVISSLAGFEALLRSKPVTTYGVPFYAGWGLTTDLGVVPARRRARRTLDELVAAVLLLYPRYLDPISGLPCPPEVLIRRIAEGAADRSASVMVQLRRLQGRWKKQLSHASLGR